MHNDGPICSRAILIVMIYPCHSMLVACSRGVLYIVRQLQRCKLLWSRARRAFEFVALFIEHQMY